MKLLANFRKLLSILIAFLFTLAISAQNDCSEVAAGVGPSNGVGGMNLLADFDPCCGSTSATLTWDIGALKPEIEAIIADSDDGEIGWSLEDTPWGGGNNSIYATSYEEFTDQLIDYVSSQSSIYGLFIDDVSASSGVHPTGMLVWKGDENYVDDFGRIILCEGSANSCVCGTPSNFTNSSTGNLSSAVCISPQIAVCEAPSASQFFGGQSPENQFLFPGLNTDMVVGAIPGGSFVNPNTAGLLMNTFVGSGLLENALSCSENDFGLNCIDLSALLQAQISEYENLMNDPDTDAEVIDILNETHDGQTMFDYITGNSSNGTNLSNDFEEVFEDVSFIEVINASLGWNLPDSDCNGGISYPFTRSGSGTSLKNNQATNRSNSSDALADVDFFKEEIPGLNAKSSAPTPMATALIASASNNLYNGTSEVSIPIHNLQAKDLQQLVALTASSNGLRVNDIGSSVGSQWNLSAGGAINRVVNGLPDELNGAIIESRGPAVTKKIGLALKAPADVDIAINIPFPACQQLCDLNVPNLCGISSLCFLEGQNQKGAEIPLTPTAVVPAADPPTSATKKMPIKVSLVYQPLRVVERLRLTVEFPGFKVGPFAEIKIKLAFELGFVLNDHMEMVNYEETAYGMFAIGDPSLSSGLGFAAQSDGTGPTNWLKGLIGGGSTDSDAREFLKKVHSISENQDNRYLSSLVAKFQDIIDALVQMDMPFADDNNTVTLRTDRLDTAPDEYHFNFDGHSGYFVFNYDKSINIFPDLPGLVITPTWSANNTINSFQITTPNGKQYTFGGGVNYQEFTTDLNLYLPNFYTYPECDDSDVTNNPTRTVFGKALIDVNTIIQHPVFGPRRRLFYGQTYNNNYKVTKQVTYTSAWKISKARSLISGEKIAYLYKPETIEYYSNKSYSHTFPNFAAANASVGLPGYGCGEDQLTTAGIKSGFDQTTSFYGDVNHPVATKWLSGRAEFAFNATHTRKRQLLIEKIDNGRETVNFEYLPNARVDVLYGHLLSRVVVKRGESDYKGFGMCYSDNSDELDDLSFSCNVPEPDSGAGSDSPVYASPSAPVASTDALQNDFTLGSVYLPQPEDYGGYFFARLTVCVLTMPVRFGIVRPYNSLMYGDTPKFFRQRMGSYGSLVDVHYLSNWWGGTTLDEQQELFRAEHGRTFIDCIEEIPMGERTGSEQHLQTTIAYVGDVKSLPKRFSVDQDPFGYYSENSTKSPLPPIKYHAITPGLSGNAGVTNFDAAPVSVESQAALQKHIPFRNQLSGLSQSFAGGWSGNTDPGQIQVGAIQRVTLPTGGYYAYTYEPNEYLDEDGALQIGYGIRVSSLTEDPSDSPARVSQYIYEDPQMINRPKWIYYNEFDNYFTHLPRFGNQTSNRKTYELRVRTSSAPLNALFANGNNHIGYGRVYEIYPGNGMITHEFSTPAHLAGGAANGAEAIDIAVDATTAYSALVADNPNPGLMTGDDGPSPSAVPALRRKHVLSPYQNNDNWAFSTERLQDAPPELERYSPFGTFYHEYPSMKQALGLSLRTTAYAQDNIQNGVPTDANNFLSQTTNTYQLLINRAQPESASFMLSTAYAQNRRMSFAEQYGLNLLRSYASSFRKNISFSLWSNIDNGDDPAGNSQSLSCGTEDLEKNKLLCTIIACLINYGGNVDDLITGAVFKRIDRQFLYREFDLTRRHLRANTSTTVNRDLDLASGLNTPTPSSGPAVTTRSEVSYTYATYPLVLTPSTVTTALSIDGAASGTNNTANITVKNIFVTSNDADLSLFDGAVLTYLQSMSQGVTYALPLYSQTTTNGTVTKKDITTLQSIPGNSGNILVPKSNYTLRNGTLRLAGVFPASGYGQAFNLPARYHLAKHGAALAADPGNATGETTDFFAPIQLSWGPFGDLAGRTYEGFGSQVEDFNEVGLPLESLSLPDGITTTHAYDGYYRLAQETGGNGRTDTDYTYGVGSGSNYVRTSTTFVGEQYGEIPPQVVKAQTDGFGKPLVTLRETDGSVLASQGYDGRWRIASDYTIERGNAFTYRYEAAPAARWSEITDAVGNVTTTWSGATTDYFGGSRSKDPNGHITFEYTDAIGQTVKQTSGIGADTEYEYDNLLRLEKITGPAGVYEYHYNDMDRVYKKEMPAAEPSYTLWNRKFQPVVSIDGNQQIVSVEYDPQNRPIRTAYQGTGGFSIGANSSIGNSPFGSGGIDLVTTSYDGSWVASVTEARLKPDGTIVANGKSTVTTARDDIGRPEATSTVYNTGLNTYTLQSAITNYTAAPLVDNIITTFEDGVELSYQTRTTYDEVMRPTDNYLRLNPTGELTDDTPEQLLTRLGYAGADRIGLRLLGGVEEDEFLQKVSYYYDGASRIVKINSPNASACAFGEFCSYKVQWEISPSRTNAEGCNYVSGMVIGGEVITLPEAYHVENDETALIAALGSALVEEGYVATIGIDFSSTGSGGAGNTLVTFTLSNILLDPDVDPTIRLLFGADCEGTFLDFEQQNCCPPTEQTTGAGSTSSADLFQESLWYDGLDISRIELYNGCNFGKIRNDYSYDANHRVTSQHNRIFGIGQTGVLNTNYDYNGGGDIITLDRWGIKELLPNGTVDFNQIDKLTYGYDTEGRLESIVDGAPGSYQPFGFSAEESSYTYDNNGNQLTDSGKGITADIVYNILNLPGTIALTDGEIKNTFSAGGAKLATEAEQEREYVAGFEIVDGAFESYQFGDGRVLIDEEEEELRYQYYIQDHLGNVVVTFEDKNDDGSVMSNVEGMDPGTEEVVQRELYYPFGLHVNRDWWGLAPDAANRTAQQYQYNGKELDENYGLGLHFYGARMYDAAVGRFTGVDPLADQFPGWSPYNYVMGNPVRLVDPDGMAPEEYPIVRITKQKTGNTVDQRVLGYTQAGSTVTTDLYKVEVTDTEDPNFYMSFEVTRDAWVQENGGPTAQNVAFEPKDGNINHFTGKVMNGGYPRGNGTEALKLTQRGSEVMHAEPNQTSVNLGYRNKADVAAGVMIHVGGNYTKGGKPRLAASEGCFGICNPGNSPSNPSNQHSNTVMNAIQAQANKSQTDPGKILIILEKRTGNEYPTTAPIN